MKFSHFQTVKISVVGDDGTLYSFEHSPVGEETQEKFAERMAFVLRTVAEPR